MTKKGLSIFLSDHRTAMQIFFYARYMLWVVKDWQGGQVYSVVGDLAFLGVSIWSYKSQLKLGLALPSQGIQRKISLSSLQWYPYHSNHGHRLLLTASPSHQNCNEDISHQNCGEWGTFHALSLLAFPSRCPRRIIVPLQAVI